MRLWPGFGWWKKNCPLIRGVRHLEYPLIGENTVNLSLHRKSCRPSIAKFSDIRWMSLIALNFWWLPLFICLNPLPSKFANSSLSVCSLFQTLAAWVFPILNFLAITLQLNSLFLASSKISMFWSNVRHRLLSFPDSRFFQDIR